MKTSKQQGIIIISVLIIIALIVTIVSLMWQQQSQNFKYTKHLLIEQQALAYIYGVESLAVKILKEDDNKIDTLAEDWAKDVPPMPILNGSIQAKLIDIQSKLNINNLFTITNSQITYDTLFKDCLNNINTKLEQDFMSDLILVHLNSSGSTIKLFEHLSQLREIEAINTDDFQKIRPFLSVQKKKQLLILILLVPKF